MNDVTSQLKLKSEQFTHYAFKPIQDLMRNVVTKCVEQIRSRDKPNQTDQLSTNFTGCQTLSELFNEETEECSE
jgi:hypothetical protein